MASTARRDVAFADVDGTPPGPDEHFSRRAALHRVGAAAALVWTMPKLTTLRTRATAGSPPPDSTTAPTEPPVIHSFVGTLSATVAGELGDNDPCNSTHHFETTTTLTNLGAASIVVDACLGEGSDGPPPVFPILDGAFTISTAEGTLTGDVVDGELRYVGLLTLHGYTINLSITGGTGGFAGAVGTATFAVGGYVTSPLSGDIRGSYQLP